MLRLNHGHPAMASFHSTLPVSHDNPLRVLSGRTNVDLNEDVIPGVISTDVHHLEDSVGEAGGHVNYLL
jgi:hypothetical protein